MELINLVTSTNNAPILVQLVSILVASMCGYKHALSTQPKHILPYLTATFMFWYAVGLLIKAWFIFV